jgi:hypothetical protein
MASPFDNMEEYMSSLKEDFVVKIVYIMIFLIIILLLCYYFYMRHLESRECSLMNDLYYKLDGKIHSISSTDPLCGHTLKDYYIKTAYNCCSGGSYKNDYVSICNLKSVLRQGARGLDFEIYSLNDEPIVATSVENSYFIKETYNSVPFSTIMDTLINYAFSNSTCPNPADPLIIHLRMKSTNNKMYDKLANTFKFYNSYLLGKEYSYENHNTNLGDVPLLSLMNKIIIIVDRSNPSFMENENLIEYVNMTSNSIFMRALNYNEVKQTPDMQELIQYNKKNMTIVFPDPGVNPPNISSLLVREMGCQMPAMRFQMVDQYLEENAVFFDNAGYAFVLKPEKLRYVPVKIAAPTPQKPELSYASRTISKDYYKFNI